MSQSVIPSEAPLLNLATTVEEKQESKAPARRSPSYYIGEAFTITTVLTGSFTLAQATIMHTPINPWETASVFFSFACTWLCTRQVRFNYVLGIISTLLLVVTFYQAKLYGSMALNLYLVPTVIYGWYMWGKDSNSRPVQRTTALGWLKYAVATLITWLGAVAAIKAFGGSVATVDGALLVGSVLAQWMLDRKKLENWIIWAIVNVASVAVYWNAGLHLLSLQFAVFFLNTIIAYREWRHSMESESTTSEQ